MEWIPWSLHEKAYFQLRDADYCMDWSVNIFSGDGKKLIGLLVIASSIFRYWNITHTRELIVLFNVRQITANSYCVICVYLASLFQKGLSERVLTSVLH